MLTAFSELKYEEYDQFGTANCLCARKKIGYFFLCLMSVKKSKVHKSRASRQLQIPYQKVPKLTRKFFKIKTYKLYLHQALAHEGKENLHRFVYAT